MSRTLLTALTALALSPAALAQTMNLSPGTAPSASLGTTTFSPSTQQVQFVAPQLIPFAGSTGNFESLVTGLTTGTPVTLATVGADGSLQIVTFTPANAVLPGDAARVLEAARQNLISRGVASPTGTQIAASLMGGTITTVSGTSALIGVLTGTSSSPTPVLVRTDTGALQNGVANANISPAQLAAVRNALATGTGITLTSAGTRQNVVFFPTGVRLSDFEVNQSLQLASTLLAQQGVLNPTADQLRVALFGGTLAGTNGAAVPLQGVLQGQLRNTSAGATGLTSTSPPTITSTSPLTNTSTSPLTNTSDSAIAGTSNSSVAGTSSSSLAGTSSSSLAGTGNSPVAGTSNSSAAATSNSSIAGTSSTSGAAASNSSTAGTSNSPAAASLGASSAGGTTTAAPLVPRRR
jgi:hypothetical protein